MKRFFLTPVFVCGFLISQAQNAETFYAIKELFRIQFPQIDTEDKLIAINIWTPSDNESRASNQAFDNAHSTFRAAKLKGGEKGLVSILLVREKPDPSVLSLLKKDGVQCSPVYYLFDAGNPALFEFKNAVFDSEGNLVFKNLYSDNIFNTVQSLITR